MGDEGNSSERDPAPDPVKQACPTCGRTIVAGYPCVACREGSRWADPNEIAGVTISGGRTGWAPGRRERSALTQLAVGVFASVLAASTVVVAALADPPPACTHRVACAIGSSVVPAILAAVTFRAVARKQEKPGLMAVAFIGAGIVVAALIAQAR